MGSTYDAPNQQVVRPDGSGPADEGTGGSTPDTEPQPKEPATEPQADTVEIPADQVTAAE